MKQPDEWNTIIARWYALIMGVLAAIMTPISAFVGVSLWIVGLMILAALFAFAVQIGYELQVGIFS